MAEIETIALSINRRGIEIKEWEPGVRERSLGFLRFIANPDAYHESEQVEVEIDIPNSRHGAREEKASFFLSRADCKSALLKFLGII